MSPYVAQEPVSVRPIRRRRRLSKKAALTLFVVYGTVAGGAIWFLPPMVAKYAQRAAQEAVRGPR